MYYSGWERTLKNAVKQNLLRYEEVGTEVETDDTKEEEEVQQEVETGEEVEETTEAEEEKIETDNQFDDTFEGEKEEANDCFVTTLLNITGTMIN